MDCDDRGLDQLVPSSEIELRSLLTIILITIIVMIVIILIMIAIIVVFIRSAEQRSIPSWLGLLGSPMCWDVSS